MSRWGVESRTINQGQSSAAFYMMGTGNNTNFSITASSIGYLTGSQNFHDPFVDLWIGGAGCSGNWNDNNCWSLGFFPPFGSNYRAYFNDQCLINCSVNLNTNISLQSIWLQPGYSASTITQQAGMTVSLSGHFHMDAGTFSGGNSTINFGATTQSMTLLLGGTFKSTSGNLNIAGLEATFNVFTHNSGTVTFVDTPGATNFLLTAALFFNNIILGETQGSTINLVGALVASGNLNLAADAGTTITGPGVLETFGNLVMSSFGGGNLTDIVVLAGGVNTYTTTGGTLPTTVFLVVNLGGSFTLNSSLLVSGTFSSSATVNLNGNSLIINGLLLNSGTLNCNGGCGAGTACGLGLNKLQCTTYSNSGTINF
jgi:hypothetical protein